MVGSYIFFFFPDLGIMSIIDQFRIKLFFVVSSLSPKSNRSKILSALLFGLYHGDTLIFDYQFIFSLFEVLFNCIILFYIYTWILVKISTLLMSLDVGKSRILTMRGLTKTRTNGELTPTAFRLVLSACKLNLPLVPSQDYVLQDNKRCYDKMLSVWNVRPPSNVFW